MIVLFLAKAAVRPSRERSAVSLVALHFRCELGCRLNRPVTPWSTNRNLRLMWNHGFSQWAARSGETGGFVVLSCSDWIKRYNWPQQFIWPLPRQLNPGPLNQICNDVCGELSSLEKSVFIFQTLQAIEEGIRIPQPPRYPKGVYLNSAVPSLVLDSSVVPSPRGPSEPSLFSVLRTSTHRLPHPHPLPAGWDARSGPVD